MRGLMQCVSFLPFVQAPSSGTFQNAILLESATKLLENEGFTVHRHRRVPAGDGGLAFGQAVLANAAIEKLKADC